MRSNTPLRRLVAGVSLTALLAGGLIVAEHRAVPATIKTQSIAATSSLIPALPSSPKLTTISPTLSGLRATTPATASPSAVNAQFLPVFNPVCAALLIARAALLAAPQNPATDFALAANAAALAFFHCVPISGLPFPQN